MEPKIYQSNFDTTTLTVLRNKVNEQQYIIFNKLHNEKRAWDKICAIMDRLDDTVEYLNGLQLNTGKYKRSAFDFFEFINNAGVVVECILELATIFNVSTDKIKALTNIFNKPGNDGKGTDYGYFKYLRSLCSVHPVATDRHARFQDNEFECSPFVIWNNGLWFEEGKEINAELLAVVYTSIEGDSHKRVYIYINQIFEHLENWLKFVGEITDAINQYQKSIISEWKSTPIKKVGDFDNYIDYLKNLNKELDNRYGFESYYSFDYIIQLFNLNLSNPENQNKMNLYLTALKYAISFEHNRLQNMSYEGCENTGLKFTQENTETTLYSELHSLSSSKEAIQYSYNWEKIEYLNYKEVAEADKQWAYEILKEALPFLENYVSFINAKGDFEHYALVQLALYLDCLENKCLININIPNKLKYRRRLLLDNEINELQSNKINPPFKPLKVEVSLDF